ncbi:hypothetical protein SADUNF_Sadunf10G0062500 [Salix dunnii]|uniref:Cytochrome b561 domain-containing protein n=1 Tax=Salix dunnii TaxID=1413687 RepID=A0A835MY36_9ROSI|nr:hypothetical protein SADUNF_Sadunf10G0062500 [Salix dunnii]
MNRARKLCRGPSTIGFSQWHHASIPTTQYVASATNFSLKVPLLAKKEKAQKIFHVTLHLIALVAGVVGVYTAFRFKHEVGDHIPGLDKKNRLLFRTVPNPVALQAINTQSDDGALRFGCGGCRGSWVPTALTMDSTLEALLFFSVHPLSNEHLVPSRRRVGPTKFLMSKVKTENQWY